LLANPRFRERFLTRLREVCATIFTREKIYPLIDAMEASLEQEVAFRARIDQQDPAVATGQFRRHIQSFRDQVTHRRDFILSELANLKQ
jgi:hypothetical protein